MKRLLRKAVALASPLLYKRYFAGSRGISWNGKSAAVSITFDVEYERDARALKESVELLDSFGIKGSFACIGKLVEEFPREHSLLADAGHEILNHTYSHPNHDVLNPNEFFNKLSPGMQEKEVAEFEKTSEKILGVKPRGFRAPHFGDLNSRSVYGILEKRGYLYSSSTVLTKTHAGGMPFFPSRENFLKPGSGETAFRVLELPVMTCPKHYYSVFDSFHCFRTTPPAHSPQEFSDLFQKSVLMSVKHNLLAAFYFDPSDVIGKKEFEGCLDFLSQKKSEVWACKSEDAAEWFASKTHGVEKG